MFLLRQFSPTTGEPLTDEQLQCPGKECERASGVLTNHSDQLSGGTAYNDGLSVQIRQKGFDEELQEKKERGPEDGSETRRFCRSISSRKQVEQSKTINYD